MVLQTAIVLALCGYADPTPSVVAEVVAVRGAVEVKRDATPIAVQRGLCLNAGDTVRTGAGSLLAISIDGGPFVYVGPGARFALAGEAGRPVIDLAQGEIRMTARQQHPAEIRTQSATASCSRGIVRVAATANATRIAAEAGKAVIRYAEIDEEADRLGVPRPAIQQRVELASGQELRLDDHVARCSLEPEGWTLTPQVCRLVVATTTSNASLAQMASAGTPGRCVGGRTPGCGPSQTPPGSTEAQAEQRSNETQAQQDQADASNQTRSGAPGISSTNLGGPLVASSTLAFGGLFSDTNQGTTAGMLTEAADGLPAGSNFPGNVHLVTGQTAYTLNNVTLHASDNFPVSREYWSIGLGASPTTQVTTGIGTGTDPTPTAVRIPHFDAYLVRLDQYNLVDPASAAAQTNQSFAISGLLDNGDANPNLNPTNPAITGASPLIDNRAVINNRATFALGEIAVQPNGQKPEFDVRRSDQDRRLLKDPGNDDNLDQVTANPDVVHFLDVPDPTFFPSNPTVKVPEPGPNGLRNAPTVRNLSTLRRAALTTIMAHELAGNARRTGQTRYVLGGRIIDITGYRGH